MYEEYLVDKSAFLIKWNCNIKSLCFDIIDNLSNDENRRLGWVKRMGRYTDLLVIKMKKNVPLWK